MRSWIYLVVAGVLVSFSANAADSGDAAYRAELQKWKADQQADLKENWLPLAGLFWLKSGENTFGSGKSNALVFPRGPEHAGVFLVEGNEISVRFLPAVRATIDGKSSSVGKLQADTTGHASIVSFNDLEMHVIQRGQRTGVRLKDLKSPAVQKFAGTVYFPVDTAYRVEGKWVPSHGNKTIDVPTVLGDVTPTPVAGQVTFQLAGRELHLTDIEGEPGKGLFFVFNDPTSKTLTYPGGRFLRTGPVKDGKVSLDFNRAYNPPCAVTPYATCPLAPKENRLSIPIPVGEKYLRHHGNGMRRVNIRKH